MYTVVNGTNGNNFLNFVGITGLFTETLVNAYTGYTITISEVKNINNAVYDGMNGNDTLSMTLGSDVLQGLDVNGTIMIKNIEMINASEGGDIINLAFQGFAYGNVTIRGAQGDDILWTNAGNDTVIGADGNDNIITGAGNDFAYGGNNNDYLNGGLGADFITGGAGDDTLVYTADDIWTGGLTLASLGSSVPFSNLVFLDGKNRSFDTFHGDTNDTGLVTAPGYDVLLMTQGADVLILSDILSPQTGVAPRISHLDEIDAMGGDDVIDLSGGLHGSVTIHGGEGNDVLSGTIFADTLNGDADNDMLYGSMGDDSLNGGSGDDAYYYNIGDGSDTITETSGNDKIVFGNGIVFSDITLNVSGLDLQVQVGLETITIVDHYAVDESGKVESLAFDDGSTFDLGSYVPNADPDAQDDSFTGTRNGIITGNVLSDNGNGADTDADNDVLSVQPQTLTTVNGGVVELLADGSFTYTPADGFVGADGFDYTILDGNGGTDTASVFISVDYKSSDIVGTQNGESIDGTATDDEIFGLGGHDTIKGQGGDDIILGGDGDDTLYGDDSILTGTTLDKVFADTITMPNLKESVNIQNLNPSGVPALGIANNNLSVDFGATANITFRKGYAGYNNSFGSFGIAEDGTITPSTMHWANVKTAGINTTHTIDLPVGADGGAYGFFIIGDGNTSNAGYAGLDITGEGNIRFVYNYGKVDARDAKITDPGAKISVIYSDGVTTKVLKGNVYFTTEREESVVVNKDGKTHVVSGLMDVNDLSLNQVKADFASKPASFSKNGITVSAVTGVLTPVGDRIGIKTAAAGDTIGGNEAIRIGFDSAAEKVVVSLSDLLGAHSGIDFKIYVEGSTIPVLFEYAVGSAQPCNGKLDIILNGSDFGGLITKIEVSSINNSSLGMETFYVDNVKAFIPGGHDTNSIRIGFEDLYNTGDADYEDVLFDLDINAVNIGDVDGGNDILDGGAGNDTLYGEGGDDILVIGLGGDHAFGGLGADTFAVTLIDGLVDTIHDFNAVDGDTINIADVLEGYDALSDDIADFVQLVQNGANMELQINADGDEGGAFVTAALILNTTGLDIASLIADQSALA